jgi:anti-sigma factor ChrR (cupin superfamily)
MSDDLTEDGVPFDPLVGLALARAVDAGAPSSAVKARLMAALASPPVPRGFAFRFRDDEAWLPHPVPGIRMKVLALDRTADYAVLLLEAAPGTRFPPHHHRRAEECYVLSGSLTTCDRRMTAGDFLHADADTDHGELFTEGGAQVLLVVSADDYIPEPPSTRP